jgi:ribosomal protein S18 acetylase RimI-like enzyme
MTIDATIAVVEARPLGANDLERVIAIDQALSGRSRRRFFEKRFASAKSRSDDVIQIGAVSNGALCGFAIARVQRGEFGHEDAVAVLDAIGVDAGHRGHGVGRLLMRELGTEMNQRRVRKLQSQAEWTNHSLLRFFDAAGFKLASRLVLQRSVAAVFDESSEEI